MKLYVRFGDEWHYPKEFIKPNQGMVVEAFEAIGDCPLLMTRRWRAGTMFVERFITH